jgi:hypothetical protein
MKKLMVLFGIVAVAFGAKKLLGGKDDSSNDYVSQQG